MGTKVRSALLLTGYVVTLSPGTEKTFGYGDESGVSQDLIPLQAREMSNLAFKISHKQGVGLVVTPLDDRIRYKREWHEGEKNSFVIRDEERFWSRGPLGGSTFEVDFNPQTNELKLNLIKPIYREFDPRKAARLIFGLRHTPIPVPVDEIFFRVPPGADQAGGFALTLEGDGLHLTPEIDLSNEPVNSVGVSTDIVPASSSNANLTAVKPLTLTPAQGHQINGLQLTFVNVSPNAVKWYGGKLCLAILLIGLAFLIGPQVRTANGFLLFSAAAFLLSLGIVLSARDFFFTPHEARFETYIQVIFWSALLLYGLRYTHGAESAQVEVEIKNASDTSGWKLLMGGLCFIVAFCALNGDWGDTNWSLFGAFYVGWKQLLLFLFGWVLVLLLTHAFFKLVSLLLEEVTNPPLSAKATGIILLLSVTPLIFYLISLLEGHRIMLWLPVLGRVYLPILFLPIMVACAILVVSAAETGEEKAGPLKVLVLILLGGTVLLYRAISGDNGGTLLVLLGLVTAFWVSTRNRLIPALLTLTLVALSVWALLATPERFDLAWRSEEAQLHYFDEAKNLRTARDLARAGGWSGQWLDLRIPSDVRSNIHNDLVSAFVGGYFGWIILGLVILAYILIYLTLWGALSSLYDPDKPLELVGFTTQNDATSVSGVRLILAMVAASLIVPLGVQCLWAFTQPLQPLLPLIGFDLQPISTSGSSVLSFLLILIGSVSVAQTAGRKAARE
ncbi:MAG TPA: hypothetical protein VEW46_19065 [Pyrinomonadaceae bacterium]|nr:hypothetical protein [Pyrinomonadaceae bacterium]